MYPDHMPAPKDPITPLFLLLEMPERESDRTAAAEQVNQVLKQIQAYLDIKRNPPVYIWLYVFGHKACGVYMGYYAISDMVTSFLEGEKYVPLDNALIRLNLSLKEDLEINARYPFYRPNILLFCSGETAANLPDELEYVRENPWFVRSTRWIFTREPLLNTASAKRFVGPGPRFGFSHPNIIDLPLHRAPSFRSLDPLMEEFRRDSSAEIIRPQVSADFVRVDPVIFHRDGISDHPGYIIEPKITDFVRADPVIPDWHVEMDHPGYIIEPEIDVPLDPPKDPVDGYISADDAFIPDFAPPKDGGTGFFIPLGPDETDTTEEQGSNGIDNSFYDYFTDL